MCLDDGILCEDELAVVVVRVAERKPLSTYRVPADACADWQHRIRISRSAGESAFANEDMAEMTNLELRRLHNINWVVARDGKNKKRLFLGPQSLPAPTHGRRAETTTR